ncbi:PRSR2 protein, partial [Amia calva]|nr:PRSR2 protein [Amia calva]
EDALQFLSWEEKECIIFFEETIDSLDDDRADSTFSSGSSTPVVDRATPTFMEQRNPSPKGEDIIDLVHGSPTEFSGLVYKPHGTDVTSVSMHPESHFEMRPRRQVTEGYPSEFTFPAPPPPMSNLEGDSFASPFYHPAGSIPTPVIIAQKIAENQAGAAPFSSTSLLTERSSSLESDRSPPPSPDYMGRTGPTTAAKPNKYPGNINVVMGGKDYNQTIAKAAVKVQERKAQVWANLTGAPLNSINLEEKPTNQRNQPTRSTSFRDPMPSKSRQEALSILGLNKNVPKSPSGSKPRVVSSPPDSPSKAGIASTDLRYHGSNPRPGAFPFGSSSKPAAYRPDTRPSENRSSRHNGAQSAHVSSSAPLSPDLVRQRPASAFRPQGITVQFSGRGATDESRRQALRKLGLLKDS